MSFLFGESDLQKKIREIRVKEQEHIRKKEERDREWKRNRESDKVTIKNELIPQIKQKIQQLFPSIDLDFFLKLNDMGVFSNEFVQDRLYFDLKFEELSYNQYIAYKLHSNIGYYSLEENDLIILHYKEFLDNLNIINHNIFMNNVNIEWKMLQLAKSDTSIQIPSPLKPPPLPKKSRSVSVSNLKIKSIPHMQNQSLPKSSRMTGEIFNDVKYKLTKPKNKSPPKPPPLPKQRHSSKNNASKSRGSPLTSKKLEDTKNSLRVVKPKSPQKKELSQNDPDYDLEMAFRNLEKDK
jgi:hypothetical protein